MWYRKWFCSTRFTKFFLIALSHESIENYYKTNFAMMQHHNYSLSDLETMIPWEREIYIQMLVKHLEQEKERNRALKNKMRK